MRHAIKMCEGVVEAGLKREVAISEQLYGFMLIQSTTDMVSALSVDREV